MKRKQHTLAREIKFAKSLCGDLPRPALQSLKQMLQHHALSVITGDVIHIHGSWYVTHSGLLRIAARRRCAGIHTLPMLRACDSATSRWVFRATVFKSCTCRGFVGY